MVAQKQNKKNGRAPFKSISTMIQECSPAVQYMTWRWIMMCLRIVIQSHSPR